MQAVPTDAEIRANAAFPLVVRAARLRAQAFWGVLPLFVLAVLYAVGTGHIWAIGVAMLLSLASVAGQLYGFRRASQPLLQISDESAVQARATKLATDDAKPRLLRWPPHA